MCRQPRVSRSIAAAAAVMVLAAAAPAQARLAGASEAKIYRYVEKSTCYTIITNMEPSEDEVAAWIPRDRYKAAGYCGPATIADTPADGLLRVAGKRTRTAREGIRRASATLPRPGKKRAFSY